MTWLRKYWGLLAAAATTIVGAVIAIFTLGRVLPKPPPMPERPETPDVRIPNDPPPTTTAADEYAKDKTTGVDDVAAAIDERYRGL